MSEVTVDSIRCYGERKIQNGHPKDGQGFYSEAESKAIYAGKLTARAVAGVVFWLEAKAMGTRLDGSKGELQLADIQALAAKGVVIEYRFEASTGEKWTSGPDGQASNTDEGGSPFVLRCNPYGSQQLSGPCTLNCTAAYGGKESPLEVSINFA